MLVAYDDSLVKESLSTGPVLFFKTFTDLIEPLLNVTGLTFFMRVLVLHHEATIRVFSPVKELIVNVSFLCYLFLFLRRISS